MKIAVIDYKMSNMFSINNALISLGFRSKITSDPNAILRADGAVLPGVGSFPEAMRHLNDLQLNDVIKDFIISGKPFMGICLGLQLLFSESDEFESCKGLGIIDGTVIGFSKYINSEPIPHIGWNTVYSPNLVKSNINYASKIGIAENNYYYFVHSFFVQPKQKNNILTVTRYGDYEFCSSILKGNVFACQFHPEKSGPRGLNIFRNFFN